MLPDVLDEEALSTVEVDWGGRRTRATTDRGQNVLRDGTLHPSTRNENAESTILARSLDIPVWSGQSFTAMRMFKLAQWVGASRHEIAAVAWGIFAFWRLHYDHRDRLAYHTLHETLDIAQNFGVPYSLHDQAAGLPDVTVENLLTQVQAEAAELTRLADYANRAVGELTRQGVPATMQEALDALRSAAEILSSSALRIERGVGPVRSLLGEEFTESAIQAVIQLVDHVNAGLRARQEVERHADALVLDHGDGARDAAEV
ncbi:hypothetical protein K8369_16270, partial [Streptomyces sp. PSKA30]|nr:hypothetical protein [Streptomyces sp. PSKA30]